MNRLRLSLAPLAVLVPIMAQMAGCAPKQIQPPKADGVTEAGHIAGENQKRHKSAATILDELERYSR